jgi:hypothetical protein
MIAKLTWGFRMTRKQTRAQDLGPFLAAASTPTAIRNRIALIGRERGLPQEEINQALEADLKFYDGPLSKFVESNNVSLDWLLMGDLRGLKRMRRPASTW